MHAKTRCCSFTLPGTYNLRLIAHRDLLPKLASLSPWALPNKHTEVQVEVVGRVETLRNPLDPSFTVHTVCVSVLHSLASSSQGSRTRVIWYVTHYYMYHCKCQQPLTLTLESKTNSSKSQYLKVK